MASRPSMEFESDRFYRLTVQREGEDPVEYSRFRFGNKTDPVLVAGETQASADAALGVRSAAQGVRDAALVERDAAQGVRDAAQGMRDAAQEVRDVAQAEGDAAQAEGDAAQEATDIALAKAAVDARMFPASLMFIDPRGQTQRLYEHEITHWELLPD